MPICANPEKKRIRVSVGDSTVILETRNYSDSEFKKFISNRYKTKGRGRIKDESWEAGVNFIDSVLTNITSENSDGAPDVVEYIDRDDKQTKVLNSSVEDWKTYIPASWKVSAALALVELNAEVEDDTLKN